MDAVIRFLRTRPAWVDAAVALVLSVIAVWLALRIDGGDTISVPDTLPVRESDPGRPDPPPPDPSGDGIDLDPIAGAMLSLLVTMPLAWRRRWPIPVFTVQFAGALLTGNAGSARVIFVSVLIGAYSCVVHGRPAWLSVGAVAAACTAVALTYSEVTPPMPEWAASFAILMPIALFGLAIRSARARADAIADRAEALRQSQEASTAAAVARERAMIARELHDIVSHHVSVMVIQAGAAEKVLSTNPGETRKALRAIAGSGREAMGELRHLLGVLAPPPGETDHPATDPVTAPTGHADRSTPQALDARAREPDGHLVSPRTPTVPMPPTAPSADTHKTPTAHAPGDAHTPGDTHTPGDGHTSTHAYSSAHARAHIGQTRAVVSRPSTAPRWEADAGIPLRPQPGLEQLEALVAKVRAAGQPVDLQCESGRLSPGIDTTAYRIVREALTNAMRYAPGARTSVRVNSDGSVLTVEVIDDGAPARQPATRGAGSGLLGLSERVAVYGGTLEAGRRISGGFRVRAQIPLEAAA